MDETEGGVQPQSKGSQGPLGGSNPAPPLPPVTNQQLLVIDGNVLQALSQNEARELAILQVEFARDVSERATQAYNRLLAVLTNCGD
jgi:hypothetical protein